MGKELELRFLKEYYTYITKQINDLVKNKQSLKRQDYIYNMEELLKEKASIKKDIIKALI